MGGAGKALNGCHITTLGSYQDWSPSDIARWIKNQGGRFEARVNEGTTHLVVSEKEWKSQSKPIPQVLQQNRVSDHSIKIVSFDWLEESLSHKTKRSEAPFRWEKIDPRSMKKTKNSMNVHEDEPIRETSPVVRGAKNHTGMMAEVFHGSTDHYVPEQEKRRIDKEIEMEKKAREQVEREDREAKELAAREEAKKAAEVFKKGAKKARNEIFSDNHHIYTDSTGFKFDVVLVKVDTKHNRNERWALTIYESNSKPYTYAMNGQFAGTGKHPSNNVLAAIGCNFPTALRVFKKEFKLRTGGVDWDRRISAAIERASRERRDCGLAVGSDVGTQRGVPVSDSAAAAATEEPDFATLPFHYIPPNHGPKGELPESEKEHLGNLHTIIGAGRGKIKPKDAEIQAWMSGANGAASGSQNRAPPQTLTDDELSLFINDLLNGGGNGDGTGDNNRRDNNDGSNVAVDTNNHGADVFGYPFNNDITDTEIQNQGNQNDDTGQQILSKTQNDILDSFEPGTQSVGETQVAQQARAEFEEAIDLPQQIEAEHNERKSVSNLPELHSGFSQLEKRKASPGMADVEPSSKKAKLTESGEAIEDGGCGGESAAAHTGDAAGSQSVDSNEDKGENGGVASELQTADEGELQSG